MKNFIYIVFVFLLASSCKPGIPNDIIQPDEMALVMHDIHIADAYIQTIYIPDSAKKVAAAFYGGIYKKFDIDSALYQKSLDYYMTNPRAMDEIYEKVTAELTKEKKVITRADSIEYAKELKLRQKKMKADSAKRADSIKRFSLVKNKDSLKKALADSVKKALKNKKADSVNKADSVRKAKALIKARMKRRADSLKGLRPLKIQN